MIKKYIVRLSDRGTWRVPGYRQAPQGDVGESEAGPNFLKADEDDPEWPDVQIAETYDCL